MLQGFKQSIDRRPLTGLCPFAWAVNVHSHVNININININHNSDDDDDDDSNVTLQKKAEKGKSEKWKNSSR